MRIDFIYCSFLLQNEEILKKATSDYQEKLKRSEEKYRLLKKHAEEKIERFLFCVFFKTTTGKTPGKWYCVQTHGTQSENVFILKKKKKAHAHYCEIVGKVLGN